MVFNWGAITQGPEPSGQTDPIELFNHEIKLNSPSINDLWFGQGDALRKWHEKRDYRDIAIVLNTGAGKTLVGLLAAQSLVNETKGRVIYVCSSIQLAHQTAQKAEQYGFGELTTYVQGDFSNDRYNRCVGPCITTYQALFNGRSIFERQPIDAIIFDDAHTAEHLIRDQFTLNIRKARFPGLFSEVSELFVDYFARVRKGVGYREVLEGEDAHGLWFVPPFAMKERLAELELKLGHSGLNNFDDTKFAWEHLKNRIDLCTLFITGSGLFFTPPYLPVSGLPYFSDEVRRLYLSATLSAQDNFVRTFGKKPDYMIRPRTTAGECERLIIIPSLNSHGKDDDVAIVKRAIEDKKTLILVPSHRRSEKWDDIAEKALANTVTEDINRFKKAGGPEKLTLINRYDGVDFPDDTCRVTVIDDLPSSIGPLERYLWGHLGLEKSLRSTVASRIVQSFGRTSRGRNDFGVVYITGRRLKDWLLNPTNQEQLPPFLKRQLRIGISVSEQATSIDDLVIKAASDCLNREQGWLDFYGKEMKKDNGCNHADDNDVLGIALIEMEFAQHFWKRDYSRAAAVLDNSIDSTLAKSRNTGAWHLLWLGYCFELLGEKDRAKEVYNRAHGCSENIPAVGRDFTALVSKNYSPQVVRVANRMKMGGTIGLPRSFNQGFVALSGSGSANETEEALRYLGEHLGLESMRPEKERGTGPDVLWWLPGNVALCMEVKTGKNKREGAHYTKRDLGQLRDHIQWVKNETDATEVLPVFIGPLVQPSTSVNLEGNERVISLSEFHRLAKTLTAILSDVSRMSTVVELKRGISERFTGRKLMWPELLDSLPFRNLSELRQEIV